MGVRGDLLYELAYVVMEAKRSHDLPSISWRPSGVIQSESKGLKTRGTDSINPSPKAPK